MSQLALELIAEEKKQKTGKIDLGNCGLTELPQELFDCVWLEELIVSNGYWDIKDSEWVKSTNTGLPNKLNHIPLEIEKLNRLKTLVIGGEDQNEWEITDISCLEKLNTLQTVNLSGNKISDISFLKKLTAIHTLDLSINQISNIGFLKNLTALQTLNLLGNKISDISSLENLTALQTLELSFNRINDINFFENLTALQKLDLYGNEISDIGNLEKLTTLQTLDLRYNNISDINFLEKLTALQTLELSGNKISDINFLEKLTALQTLELSGNKISDISLLEKFTALQTLDLSYNKISDISYLEKHTNLQTLNLSGNEINDISILEKHTSLKTLHLNYNQISNISYLEKLTVLQILDLRKNQISDISFLGKHTNLQTLNLSGNKISDISSLLEHVKIGLLPVFKDYPSNGEIALGNNPLANPPISIIEEGRESVISWLEQMKEGSDPLYESKLMILGQPEAGKSTFTKLQFKPNHTVKDGKFKSTLGVEVHKGKSFEHTEKENTNVTAHLWDFGGQNIQKMLHQFFITDDCVYVLVSDKRAENTNFDYWFQIINMLGPNSKVIVLENPKNINSTSVDFAINTYRELYPKLDISTQEVNLKYTLGKHKARWKALNETIAEKLSSLEIVNRHIPIRWAKVRDALNTCRERKYLTKDEYYKLCTADSIGLTKVQADLCLYYFRSLGELSYYDDMGLCARIFLDHNWLTSGIYYILSDKSIEKNKGRFTRQQAYNAWEKQGYNEEEKQMLLSLLLKDKFDICYALPENKDVFIAPILLPDDKPIWDRETNLFFRYQYGFIPHGMFSRLIVKLHEKIDSEQRWKTGVRLIDNYNNEDVYAEIQQIINAENQKVIEIKIVGNKEGTKKILSFIRTAIHKLHKDFKNLPLQEQIACNCEACSNLTNTNLNPNFYKFEELQERILNKIYTIECRNAQYKSINIGQILSDVVLENSAQENLDSQLLNQLKEMGMSINQINNNNTVTQSDFGKAQANSKSHATAKAEATNTITIEIKNLLGETEMLKEDIEDERPLLEKEMDKDTIDVTLKDIEKAEKAINEIQEAKIKDEEPAQKSKNRLSRFMADIEDEESSLFKTLSTLRKGRDYGIGLAESYNKIAENIGMPLVPPLALDLLKKI